MNFDAIQREFNIRYYYWAVRDFRREIEQDFPFLNTFKSGGPRVIVQMMSRMDINGQVSLATGLVKRFHADAVDALGECMTAYEKQLCEEYLAEVCRPNAHELALLERSVRGERGVYANRAKLRRLVRTELQSRSFNMVESEAHVEELIYVNTVENWQIYTSVSTSERDAQLSYHHDIWSVRKVKEVVLPDGTKQVWPLQLRSLVSLFSWFGISSQTRWEDLVDADGPLATRTLAVVSDHFLDAAPKLLAGLSPD